MLFNHRAARALLAGLLVLTPAVASAQSLADAVSTGSGAPLPATTSTSSSTTATPAASAKPTPHPTKAAARATEPGTTTHSPGQPPTANESSIIVVTAATRNTQAVNTTATDTTVITHEELQAQNYEDVADALREVPGVAVVVEQAAGTKCARSWKILPTVGSDPEYPDVSPRDAEALREWKALGVAV